MDRDSVKWLLVGLLGSISVIAFVAVAMWFVYSPGDEWTDSLAEGPPERLPAGAPVEKRVGMETRVKKEAEHFETLDAAPWLNRYRHTSAEEEWYDVLYSEEDFGCLEAYLGEKLTSREDGWDIREYSNLCTGLGLIRYGEDPDLLGATLERWRTLSPESHHAWLVSGVFYQRLAWVWRGSGYSNTVAEEGWEKYREFTRRSLECLERSYDLKPSDPESSYNLLQSARAMGLGASARETYFGRVMEISPNHYHAWNEYWFGVAPKWGGSWEELDAVIARTEALKEEYPILGSVRLGALREMRRNREGYEDIFKDEEVLRDIVALYERLLERWPDKALFHMNYAYFVYWYVDDYGPAAKHFDAVGDQYYRGSAWGKLATYNKARARTYATHATSLEAEERFEYLSLAHELAPDNAYVAQKMGRFYEDSNDLAEAEKYFRMASELDPEYGPGYRALGNLYNRQGRFEDAIAVAKEGLNEKIGQRELMKLRIIIDAARTAIVERGSNDN